MTYSIQLPNTKPSTWNYTHPDQGHLILTRDSIVLFNTIAQAAKNDPKLSHQSIAYLNKENKLSKRFPSSYKEKVIDQLLEIDEIIEERLETAEPETINEYDQHYIVLVPAPVALFANEEDEDLNEEILSILQKILEYGSETGIHLVITQITPEQVEDNDALERLFEDLSNEPTTRTARYSPS